MIKFKYKPGQGVQYELDNGDIVYGKITARFLHPTSKLPCYAVFFEDNDFASDLHDETTNFGVLWEKAKGFHLRVKP